MKEEISNCGIRPAETHGGRRASRFKEARMNKTSSDEIKAPSLFLPEEADGGFHRVIPEAGGRGPAGLPPCGLLSHVLGSGGGEEPPSETSGAVTVK